MRNSLRTFVLAPVTLAALVGLAAAPAAQAQNAAAASVEINVSAGPLAQALASLARATGTTLVVAPGLVEGKQAPAVSGNLTAQQAFDRLLAGSGLVAEVSGRDVVVRSATGRAAAQANDSLPEVEVKGSGDGGSATAPLIGYHASVASSASKTERPILATAQSISVVTADQIADRKAISVEEAVAYASGVRIGGSGLDPRYDQITIRGYAATSNADFLDGLRQANTGWLSYFTSEAYALERIEVLKGPASVLYGQISPGGMVNRVSKRPSEEALREVQVQYGSNRHMQAQFDIGGWLDEGGSLRYRLVGLARDAETDIEQVNNDTTLLAPSLLWRISDRTKLTLLGQFQDRLTAGSPRTWQDGESLTHFWAGDERFDKLDQRQWTLGYEFEHAFSDRLKLQQNLRYGDVDTVNQYLSATGSSGTVIERASYGVYETMRSLTTDTRLAARLETRGVRHDLLAGVDWAWLDYDVVYAYGRAPSIDSASPNYVQEVSVPENVYSDLSGRSTRTGLYVSDQLSIDRWRLSAGLRKDLVDVRGDNHLTATRSTEKDNELTGQIGALYLFDAGLAPYASYAQSFLPNTGTNAYGARYKSTEGEQFELGLKYQPPGSRTLYTASVYQLTQSNVLTSDPGNSLNRLQTGEQRSRGVELEAVSDLSRTLRLTAGYSFNRAEITRNNDGTQGRSPTNTPRHLASAWLNYRVPEGALAGLSLSAGLRYTGSSFDDAQNTRKNGAYAVGDLGLGYDLHGALDKFRVELHVKNVADKRYIVCDSGYCYRGEGRAVIASLGYRW